MKKKSDTTKIVFDPFTLDGLKPLLSTYMRMEAGRPGFGIRVYPSGTKTFFFRYKIDGQSRFMELGNYPKPGLAAARAEYDKAAIKVKDLRKGRADGVDPVEEIKKEAERRVQEREDRLKAPSIAELIDLYIARYAKRFKKSWSEDQRILVKEVLPVWGKRKAADIKKRDVLNLLEMIIIRPAPVMANNTFKILRKMFNWSVEQDILTASPAYMVKLPSPVGGHQPAVISGHMLAFFLEPLT